MPHDQWIIGEGLESPGRWYVIHTRSPRFIVEVVDEAEWVPDGLSWSLANGQIAVNPEFIDEPPTGSSLDSLMFELAEVLDDYDVRVDRRIARDKMEADDE